MESIGEIIMGAPGGAEYYSDITKGYYLQHPVTGSWYIYNPSIGWSLSSHGKEAPRGLTPLFDSAPGSVVEEDKVNQPSHYKRKSSNVLRTVRRRLLEDGDVQDLECIEAMLSHFSTVDQIRGYLRGNSFKYRWRYEDKEPIRSLKSARWYESKLQTLEETIEELGGEHNES